MSGNVGTDLGRVAVQPVGVFGEIPFERLEYGDLVCDLTRQTLIDLDRFGHDLTPPLERRAPLGFGPNLGETILSGEDFADALQVETHHVPQLQDAHRTGHIGFGVPAIAALGFARRLQQPQLLVVPQRARRNV